MKLTLDDLPESLREVVELIGLSATLKLVEHYGGLIAVYVPREIEPDHRLARDLGSRPHASSLGTTAATACATSRAAWKACGASATPRSARGARKAPPGSRSNSDLLKGKSGPSSARATNPTPGRRHCSSPSLALPSAAPLGGRSRRRPTSCIHAVVPQFY